MSQQRYDAEFVEFVVQEVIRRLTGAGVQVAVAPASGANGSAGRELVIGERLITLATLQGRLDGVSQLVVTRKSLMTPAVRDELKRRNISFRKQ